MRRLATWTSQLGASLKWESWAQSIAWQRCSVTYNEWQNNKDEKRYSRPIPQVKGVWDVGLIMSVKSIGAYQWSRSPEYFIMCHSMHVIQLSELEAITTSIPNLTLAPRLVSVFVCERRWRKSVGIFHYGTWNHGWYRHTHSTLKKGIHV